MVAASQDYDCVLLTRFTNPYTFTGRRYDPETGLYYYRARYYDPKLGRFISRDPIGFEGSEWNLYEYVESMPLDGVDPTGLQHSKRSACRIAKQNFAKWFQQQKQMGNNWTKSLPNCPCDLPIVCKGEKGTDFESPDPDKWILDGITRDAVAKGYHPGAAACMRSTRNAQGASQQCCYDSDGKLITEGRGAGTADFKGIGFTTFPGHMMSDVRAWNYARFIDDNCRPGTSFVDRYQSVRPVNQGEPNGKGNANPCGPAPDPDPEPDFTTQFDINGDLIIDYIPAE